MMFAMGLYPSFCWRDLSKKTDGQGFSHVSGTWFQVQFLSASAEALSTWKHEPIDVDLVHKPDDGPSYEEEARLLWYGYPS